MCIGTALNFCIRESSRNILNWKINAEFDKKTVRKADVLVKWITENTIKPAWLFLPICLQEIGTKEKSETIAKKQVYIKLIIHNATASNENKGFEIPNDLETQSEVELLAGANDEVVIAVCGVVIEETTSDLFENLIVVETNLLLIVVVVDTCVEAGWVVEVFIVFIWDTVLLLQLSLLQHTAEHDLNTIEYFWLWCIKRKYRKTSISPPWRSIF